MRNILGLNFGHDGSIAVISNGRLVCAVSNERISRIKKASGVTREMVEYALQASGLKLEEIEACAFATYFYSPDNFIRVFNQKGMEVQNHLVDLFGGETHRECLVKVGERVMPGYFVQHHIAHCASSFYSSPFERAACFSVDASGRHPEACSLFCYGEGSKLHYHYCPGVMIGNVYSVFTEKLGLGPGLTKAGTTMGLAPYGKPLPTLEQLYDKFACSFYDRTFQPNEYRYIEYLWSLLANVPPHLAFPREESDSQRSMDLAATLQEMFERALVGYATKLHRETIAFNGDNLCLSGGSFLNSETNMRIKRESGFRHIHLFPGCGDDGTAVGAALFVLHHVFGLPRVRYEASDFMYLGREYAISPVLKHGNDPYTPEALAKALSEGKIVAWFNGRSEFGPRALGNRSILADPRAPGMKDKINSHIKKREWFRPFAPSVLEEAAAEWFDIDFPSKLMLFIARCRKPELVPAIVHVDGTSRLQTVSAADNARYHGLLTAFHQLTGVPMLLNTSLNINNEPLVETPEDAIRFFNTVDVDLMVLHDRQGGTIFSKS